MLQIKHLDPDLVASVSILTLPEGKVLQTGILGEHTVPRVSILTLPEGKVLLALVEPPELRQIRFNPHLARGQGATDIYVLGRLLGYVSILTLPEGKVLPRTKGPGTAKVLFQSSPCPRARCY